MFELARRSRGTPRIANSHLYWIRNYAISRSDGTATLSLARDALAMQEVDGLGLDRQDRRYLDTLIRVFSGGPVGVEAMAATMNVPADTLADEVGTLSPSSRTHRPDSSRTTSHSFWL